MNVIIIIDGREALPIRAIPYVTSWGEAPDGIVQTFRGTRLRDLTAYGMDAEGNYKAIPASQWNEWLVRYTSLTKKLQADERDGAENENYWTWRINAVLGLPDNAFVWLDEFQQWYSKMQRDYKREEDSLWVTPILPPEIEGKLWRYAGKGEMKTVMEAEPEQPELDTSEATDDTRADISLSRNQVMNAFAVKPDADENFKYWDERLSRPPQWLLPAQVQRGKPGESSRWNPLMIAHCLLDKKEMTRPQLNKVMHKEFPESYERWKEETKDLG